MRLGELPTRGLAGQQDAFHVPAVMAIPDHDVWPGACVRFTDDTMTRVVPCDAGEREGVIDPLLAGGVAAGTLVWVCLDNSLVPGTLTHQFQVVRRPPRVPIPPVPVIAATDGIPVAELTDLPTQTPTKAVPEESPEEPPEDWGDDDDEADCNVRPPCV